MAAKIRRHSVAIMSTSFLTPSLTPLSSVSPRTSANKNPLMTPTDRVISSKVTDRAATSEVGGSRGGEGAGGGQKTPASVSKTSPSFSSSSATSTVRARRHSVAVHPGAVLSVMESGRQATAAPASSKKPGSKSNPTTASDVIDDLIRSADASLIRNSPLPTGSVVLQAAIQELDEPTGEQS